MNTNGEIDNSGLSNILIIEDEMIIAENIAQVLSKKGDYNFFITNNRKEALLFFSNNHIQLIISDISLGEEENGIEIIKEIHAKKWVPVIFITAFNRKSYLDEAVSIDAVTYLIKPFLEEQLLVAFSFALNKINQNANAESIAKPKGRELQIIELLAKGYKNRTIGDHLHISEHTVKTHRKNLIRKYEAKSTYELIALATKMKWIN